MKKCLLASLLAASCIHFAQEAGAIDQRALPLGVALINARTA